MARHTHQKGNLQFHGGVWTVRYKLLNHQEDRWAWKRERLEGCYDKNNKKAAIKAKQPIMVRVNEYNNNPRPTRKAVTFREFVDGLWKSYTAERGIERSTIEGYNSMIKQHLMPAFGSKWLDQLTPADMTAFFASIKGKTSDKYALNLYQLLNIMMEVASQFDLIDKKPLRSKLHKPQYKPKEKPTLEIATVKQIIAKADERHRPFLLLLAFTGIRLGEALALRWQSVDLENRVLYITHSLWRGSLKPPKTAASARTLGLPVALVDVLKQHKERAAFVEPTDYLFCKSDGRPYEPDHLREVMLYPAMDSLGIVRTNRQYGFHIFRHTAGSIAYDKTLSSKAVQKMLGHASERTTSDIYIHVTPQVVTETIESVAAAFVKEIDQTLTSDGELVN
jgi:integrase